MGETTSKVVPLLKGVEVKGEGNTCSASGLELGATYSHLLKPKNNSASIVGVLEMSTPACRPHLCPGNTHTLHSCWLSQWWMGDCRLVQEAELSQMDSILSA